MLAFWPLDQTPDLATAEEVGSVHVSFQKPLKQFMQNQSSEKGSPMISV